MLSELTPATRAPIAARVHLIYKGITSLYLQIRKSPASYRFKQAYKPPVRAL